jgi:predicted Ser/Thr protein kinase
MVRPRGSDLLDLSEMSRDEELANTVTELDSAPGAAASLALTKLGRYLIERELGDGGMGVVYAAFDPELERNVAIKVIRRGLVDDADKRLLREARAMARLAHPNVVTVYEVGTVDGRDYIAMELIDGGNLVDWLRTAKPTQAEILQAFVAAGRGLATAHEVGLVHRDFKPHNVLRTRGGRVMVTDFGLAREAANAPAPRTTPVPVSLLSGLTEPGSLLGTPAYMAPEQWNGGEVTPATDQFAFCVALWEALAGERPFRGDSSEELRAQIGAGPDQLDTSKLPRRFRTVLVRGLAIDPAKRWPTMAALLAHLERRRRSIAMGIAAVAVIGLSAALVAESRHADDIVTCVSPGMNPASVWSVPLDVPIRAGSPDAANLLGAMFHRWQAVRADVCRDSSPVASARLGCLDKVLTRIDALRRVRLMDPTTNLWGVVSQGYEADVCLRPDPPRLPAHYSDAALIGLALRGGARISPDKIETARSDLAHDDCARAYFGFLDPSTAESSMNASQVCGDDQAFAAATMNAISQRIGTFPDPSLTTNMAAVERAVDHAAQPFLTRQFARFRSGVATLQGDLDPAIASLDLAIGGPLAEYDIEMKLLQVKLRLQRCAGDDLDKAIATLASLPPNTPAADTFELSARWLRGEDVATKLDAANASYLATTPPPAGPAIHGVVVDEKRTPVADAIVFAGPDLQGDATFAMLALYNPYISAYPYTYVKTTTDAHGQFAFAHAYPGSVVVAQKGASRSIRSHGALVIQPTITVHGSVAGPRPAGQLFVEARIPGDAYSVMVPIHADGTYTLGGVTKDFVARVAVVQDSRTNQTATASIGGALAFPANRELTVTVRSATAMPFEAAQVSIVSGALHAKTVGELRAQMETRASASDLARASARSSELVAHVRGAPVGVVTACSWGVHVDRDDPDFLAHFNAKESQQPLACVELAANATEGALAVPAMNRVN